jgi:hypothetical protein
MEKFKKFLKESKEFLILIGFFVIIGAYGKGYLVEQEVLAGTVAQNKQSIEYLKQRDIYGRNEGRVFNLLAFYGCPDVNNCPAMPAAVKQEVKDKLKGMCRAEKIMDTISGIENNRVCE